MPPGEWVETLEGALFSGQNAAVLIELLSPFYGALGIPDRTAPTQAPVQRGRKPGERLVFRWQALLIPSHKYGIIGS